MSAQKAFSALKPRLKNALALMAPTWMSEVPTRWKIARNVLLVTGAALQKRPG